MKEEGGTVFGGKKNYAFCQKERLKDTISTEGSLIVLGILGTGAEESSSGSRIVLRSAGRFILFR